MDKLYKNNSIPVEYSHIAVIDCDYFFFDNEDVFSSNGYYVQRFVQGAYIVDFHIEDFTQTVVTYQYETTDDYMYRADATHICYTFLFFVFLLCFGINILMRVFYNKGVF